MGAILDLSTACRPFFAEARRESFYVNTRVDDLVLEAREAAPRWGLDGDHDVTRGPAFSVELAHVLALVATLDEVAAHRSVEQWRASWDGNRRALYAPDRRGMVAGYRHPLAGFAASTAEDLWTITRQDGRLVVAGPVISFERELGWRPVQTIEVCYRDLPSLVQGLVRAG